MGGSIRYSQKDPGIDDCAMLFTFDNSEFVAVDVCDAGRGNGRGMACVPGGEYFAPHYKTVRLHIVPLSVIHLKVRRPICVPLQRQSVMLGAEANICA